VPVLPAIPLDFEDAMSRILKAKPESKKPTKRKVAKKRRLLRHMDWRAV